VAKGGEDVRNGGHGPAHEERMRKPMARKAIIAGHGPP
jgi:hypothetical protein